MREQCEHCAGPPLIALGASCLLSLLFFPSIPSHSCPRPILSNARSRLYISLLPLLQAQITVARLLRKSHVKN